MGKELTTEGRAMNRWVRRTLVFATIVGLVSTLTITMPGILGIIPRNTVVNIAAVAGPSIGIFGMMFIGFAGIDEQKTVC